MSKKNLMNKIKRLGNILTSFLEGGKMKNRMLLLDGGINFRELGGCPTKTKGKVKWHKLLRSGSLAQLSTKDVDSLEQYGLRYVVDLRTNEESTYSPDKLSPKMKYLSTSVYPFSKELLANLGIVNNLKLKATTLSYNQQVYLQMLLDPHSRAAYQRMFNVLLQNTNENEAVVFHCTAGKDRTGIAAFLILSALEVDFEAILEDYLLTNLYFSDYSATAINHMLISESKDKISKELNQKVAVLGEDLRLLKQACELISGSMEQFLEEYYHLTPSKLRSLRKIYVRDEDGNDVAKRRIK